MGNKTPATSSCETMVVRHDAFFLEFFFQKSICAFKNKMRVPPRDKFRGVYIVCTEDNNQDIKIIFVFGIR